MKKILFLLTIIVLLVSCKDNLLLNQIDNKTHIILSQQGDTVAPLQSDTTINVSIESEKAVLNVYGTRLNFIKVVGGTFQMGTEDETRNEQPVHSVTLSDYFIGETEVTQALWTAVMGNNPSITKGENLPVTVVNWADCKQFISKLNQITGYTFSLPTEAQWEFAARGGNYSQGFKFSGSNTANDVAWYCDHTTNLSIQPVATKKANELGLYDMSGNVAEICEDGWYNYSSSHQINPIYSYSGDEHVLRGGSIHQDERICSSTYRSIIILRDNAEIHGLRLVLLQQKKDETIECAVTKESDKIVLKVSGVKMNLIKIEGGTFQMGSTNGYLDEQPMHSVTLSDYYIGETEVTQALWVAVMGSNPSNFQGNNFPVDNISWDDCLIFISKLNQLLEYKYIFTLPTEAQWEYAARGGNKSCNYIYSGSNSIDNVAWYWNNSTQNTHSVKTKQANELGIYDMSGNISEWCQDWYGSYNNYTETNPTGPSSGEVRTHRGGNSGCISDYCRATYRAYGPSDYVSYYMGLRIAISFVNF